MLRRTGLGRLVPLRDKEFLLALYFFLFVGSKSTASAPLIEAAKSSRYSLFDPLMLLLAFRPNYVAFLASFFYVGIIWLNHRAVFSRVRFCDRSVHLANLFILLTSGLIPFPTALLSTTLQGHNASDAIVAVRSRSFALRSNAIPISLLRFFLAAPALDIRHGNRPAGVDVK